LNLGASVHVSDLVAAAQAVTGVESVEVTRLERLGSGPRDELARGVLPLGSLEVAQVDNDPNFPENGRITFLMRGGR
jgi:hypothetical protein